MNERKDEKMRPGMSRTKSFLTWVPVQTHDVYGELQITLRDEKVYAS